MQPQVLKGSGECGGVADVGDFFDQMLGVIVGAGQCAVDVADGKEHFWAGLRKVLTLEAVDLTAVQRTGA